MSFWDKIIDAFSGSEKSYAHSQEVPHDASRYAFVDVEVGIKDLRIRDIGALRWDGAVYHSANKREQTDNMNDVKYKRKHKIIHHDAK